jgi:hypothetical protein
MTPALTPERPQPMSDNPQPETPAGAPDQPDHMPGSQSVPPLEPVVDPFIDKPESVQPVTEADQTGEAATEKDSPDSGNDDGA